MDNFRAVIIRFVQWFLLVLLFGFIVANNVFASVTWSNSLGHSGFSTSSAACFDILGSNTTGDVTATGDPNTWQCVSSSAGNPGSGYFVTSHDDGAPTCTNGGSVSSGTYDMGTSPAVKSSTCSGGCEATYSGGGISQRALVNGQYHYYSTGSYSQTGQSCTGSDTTPTAASSPPSPTCGSGQVLGEFNGKQICLASGTDPVNPNTGSPNTNPSNPTTTTNPPTSNGDGTTTETTVSTSPNGTTTSTTKTCVTATGVCTTTTDTTGDDPLTDFCKDNPKSKICTDEQSDASGSCSGASANVVCDGDAILCAIFRQQMIQDCILNATNDESALYGAVKAGTDSGTTNNPAASGNRESHDISTSINVSHQFTPTCVSDLTITVLGRDMTLPFSHVCPYLEIMGNIVVVGALLVAGRIVGGA